MKPAAILAILIIAATSVFAKTLPLDGAWHFEMDRADQGLAEQWFDRELADRISLPGILQAQGFGDEISADTPWVLGLGGEWWKLQPADIRDYLGQGTALIGVLDAFWDPKSYVKAEEFRRFHSATVPLARLKQRVFTTAESLDCEVEIYHFGAAPIGAAKPWWKVIGQDGAVFAEGTWESRDIPLGKNIPLGSLSVPLKSMAAPAACRLVIGLHGTKVENDWNFWVYPDAEPAAAPDGVLLTRSRGSFANRCSNTPPVCLTEPPLPSLLRMPMRFGNPCPAAHRSRSRDVLIRFSTMVQATPIPDDTEPSRAALHRPP